MFCMTNYDSGLRALSRREPVCSACPRLIQKRESEKGTTTALLKQRLNALGKWTSIFHLRKFCNHFILENFLLHTEGLIFEPRSLVSQCQKWESLPPGGGPAKLDKHRGLIKPTVSMYFLQMCLSGQLISRRSIGLTPIRKYMLPSKTAKSQCPGRQNCPFCPFSIIGLGRKVIKDFLKK